MTAKQVRQAQLAAQRAALIEQLREVDEQRVEEEAAEASPVIARAQLPQMVLPTPLSRAPTVKEEPPSHSALTHVTLARDAAGARSSEHSYPSYLLPRQL